MKLPNNNYIKKANDLYFCLNRFIDHNISENNKIYIFHLDSKTKDYELFRSKILKNWKWSINFTKINLSTFSNDQNKSKS